MLTTRLVCVEAEASDIDIFSEFLLSRTFEVPKFQNIKNIFKNTP